MIVSRGESESLLSPGSSPAHAPNLTREDILRVHNLDPALRDVVQPVELHAARAASGIVG